MTRNTLGRSCLLEANLILVAGVTNTYRLRWLRRVTDRQGATVARPMDLTGWTPIMQIRRDRLIVFDLTPYVRLDEHGCITITVPADTTRDLPEGSAAGICYWPRRTGIRPVWRQAARSSNPPSA